jgi:hypothetical protein
METFPELGNEVHQESISAFLKISRAEGRKPTHLLLFQTPRGSSWEAAKEAETWAVFQCSGFGSKSGYPDPALRGPVWDQKAS